MRALILILMLLMNCSIVSAYTPSVAVEIIDDSEIYNPNITQSLNKYLIHNLSTDDKFVLKDKEDADYLIEGRLIGVGTGKLINNAVGTAFTFGGSGASLFISPFAGPVIGAIGMAQIQKNVFAIAVGIHVIRVNDKKIIYKKAFLGTNNLKKADLSPEVLDKTILNASELIIKRLKKDVNKDEPKIFIEPIRPNNERIYIKVNK